jgi:transcriptional regulator with XRE-family HTH domain
MNMFSQGHVAKAFGCVLREARADRGMSQEELAELADLDRTYPSFMERGLRQPTVGRLIGLAHALGVDPSALITMAVKCLRAGVLP